MVTKSKHTSAQEEGKGRVKVGKLKLNRETVKDLTAGEQKKVKGGAPIQSRLVLCSAYSECCP